VKDLPLINSSPVYIEVCQGSLKVLKEGAGLELALERAANGRLTSACKESIAAGLQKFLDRKPWQPRATAFCAIGANGVSLRRLSLPASGKDDLQRLLLLQIESEFPLSPDELAWGWQSLPSKEAGKQDVLVVAIRQEVVADYAEALMAGGVKPVFTLGALARAALGAKPSRDYALLDINGSQAELVTFENGVPVSARVFPLTTVAEATARALGSNWNGQKLILTGANDETTSKVTRALGGGAAVETLVTESGTGRSPAIQGLKKSVALNGGSLPLTLQVKAKRVSGKFNLANPDAKLWAMRAAALLCALLILPYAEALILKPFLTRKLAALKADKGRLTMIDRELDFLQSLKQSQPPYLDAIYLMSKLAPQGSKIESLTMNRRGEVSLRGSVRDASQVTDFRTKLINSGFFANIAVEEQAPGQQKLNVRISAQWKPVEARANLTNGPTVAEIEYAKTNKSSKGGGSMPSMPSGMMPSGPMPSGAFPIAMPPGGLPPNLSPEVLKQIQAAQPR